MKHRRCWEALEERVLRWHQLEKILYNIFLLENHSVCILKARFKPKEHV